MSEKIEITTEPYLKLTNDLIGEAASIAKTAYACATAGNAQGAYSIAFDFDERRGLPDP